MENAIADGMFMQKPVLNRRTMLNAVMIQDRHDTLSKMKSVRKDTTAT